MSIATAALKRPITTLSATIALVMLGVVSLTQLPVSLLPDVQLPVLTIRTPAPGASAEEVSQLVATQVEQAVAATPGLVDLKSVSRNGEVTTTLRFAWGTNMNRTILAVRERLDQSRGSTSERSVLLTSDPGERPIAVLALSSSGDLRSISRTAKDVHARRLEQLDGVASVAVVGEPTDEIRIEIDATKSRSLGITPDQVASAVQSANAAAGGGGQVRRGQFRFAINSLTQFKDISEISRTPVGPTANGLTLADIGTVHLTAADPVTLTTLDSKPAVGLVVYKDAGSNTVDVTKNMYKVIDELQKNFPDVTIKVVAAQAEFVNDALSNLGQEIFIGGALSLLVILLFLRDWKSSLAIGLMVPLSVLVSLTLLQVLGVTINILSLGGLALGVGLLVDNAIVVAESAGKHIEHGMGRWEAARIGTDEVAGPLIAGTLTTVLVFGPIIFVQGLAAALFRDLSLSVVMSVGASLILALTLMPVMMAWGHRAGEPAHPDSTVGRKAEGILDRAGMVGTAFYERGMRWSLAHPGTCTLIAIVVTAFTVYVVQRLPREILPRVDERIAVAYMTLPQGTAIEETSRQTKRIEDAARALGASGMYSRIGLATNEEVLAGADPGSAGNAQLIIPVPSGVGAADFAQQLRKRVPDLANGFLAIDLAGQSEFGSLIGREGRLIRVEVVAPTRELAAEHANKIRESISSLKSLSDVRDAYSETQPTVEISLNRERLAHLGISAGQVASAIKAGLGGVSASDFRETDRRTPIVVRYAGSDHEDLNTTLATLVNGTPLRQLVNVREIRAPIEVVRIDQRPVSVVEATAEKEGLAKAAKDIKQRLASLSMPPGTEVRISGAQAEQERTTKELSMVAVLSVALVFLVLAGEFASFTTPLLVMLTVPLAGVGGIIFLWLTGQSINAVSLIGIVVMIGMADNEAVVKLEAIQKYRSQGHSIEEAIMLGGHQRLRAIAMTSITTITGVLPLVFGWGSGGELYQPLAAGVIGGSVSALAVTFFLLPTAYAVVERRKERRAAARRALSVEVA